MAMTPANSEWQSRPQVIKGNIGERIVREYLEQKGFVVYEPVTDKAHGFDKFAMKNKSEIIYIECKSKSRRNYYEDTGINIEHYRQYIHISSKHNMNMFIFFVDEMLQEIYGNWLRKLREPAVVNGKRYPSIERGIIYFPLKNMATICKLSREDAGQLRGASTRNYEYCK